MQFLPQIDEIIGWRERKHERPKEAMTPWRPVALDHSQWPPNYKAVYAWRIKQLAALRANPDLLASAKAYYRRRPAEFIMHWMDTYDPRRARNKWIPFVFFSRQAEFIQFLDELRYGGENGLVEKCRDAGATWLSCGYSIHSWLNIQNDAIGWGSRKEALVDKLGDPDSIFEKLRLILRRLPSIWLPEGFSWKEHATFCKLINPETGATITGEAGDNIGRGGRKSMYFKEERAHYERPEKIESALGDNTNVQIDISSVNGLGNVFHRRREAGQLWTPGKPVDDGFTRVFIIDWRDHPDKTEEWYQQRKARYEREGMAHIFAQEVDRNYSAAVENTIISLEWINAAVDAHLRIPYLRRHPDAIPNVWTAGLDVADGGVDRNAIALRQWIILRNVEEWGERDTGVTTRRACAAVRGIRGINVFYDCIGVGAGVKAEYNRLVDAKILTDLDAKFFPWNAGAGVVNPYEALIPDDDNSPLNKDMFGNMKAQAWWSIRTRFYKTFKAVTENAIYPADELISLDSNMPLLQQLIKELAQPTHAPNGSMQTIVNKKPNGTKSPNLADAVIEAYFPIDDEHQILVGHYGT